MANANKFVSEGTVVEAEDEGGALAPDEDAEKRLDRAWYDDDEGGGAHGDAHNPFNTNARDEARYAKKEQEYAKRLTRRDGSLMSGTRIGDRVAGASNIRRTSRSSSLMSSSPGSCCPLGRRLKEASPLLASLLL